MTHDEKVRFMIDDLLRRGVTAGTAAPPLYRMMWRCGLRLRPPLFQGFSALFAVFGLWFAIGWGALMALLVRGDAAWSTGRLLGTAAVGGVLVGAMLAAVFRRRAKALALPPWDRYPPDGHRQESA